MIDFGISGRRSRVAVVGWKAMLGLYRLALTKTNVSNKPVSLSCAPALD
ncbi:hypothetical protein [Parasphingorhabdus sp. NYA22]